MSCYERYLKANEPLAQLAEHLTFNQRVWSSNLQWLINRLRYTSEAVFYMRVW